MLACGRLLVLCSALAHLVGAAVAGVPDGATRRESVSAAQMAAVIGLACGGAAYALSALAAALLGREADSARRVHTIAGMCFLAVPISTMAAAWLPECRCAAVRPLPQSRA